MEFLGMIEEAAGTKMYDEKKEEAIREMDKKQRKVDEITKVLFFFPSCLAFRMTAHSQILKEEITPQLDHLKKQKAQFDKWNEGKRDTARLEKFTIAYHYDQAKHTFSQSEKEVKDLEARVRSSLDQSIRDQ